MKNYNRISANNQLPMIESLRVPTNADEKIYGHVVVPEGVEAKPRDAWTGEVEVTLRITYADTTKSPVEITALTQGQTDENEGAGYNPWGEGEQGGLFEVQVPNEERLTTGDQVQVVAAKKVRGGQEVTELDSSKTTVDVIPPEPANLSTTLINAASRTITGTGEAGALVSLKKNQAVLSETTIDDTGKFVLSIPENQLFAGDVLEIVLNDQAGEAAAKGVQNKPSTNDEIGNHNPSDTPVVYHDAPPFAPATKIVVEGGLSFLAPSKLDFGQIKATGLTQEAFGQMDIQEKLWIYDQRETKSPWILTIKLSQPFTTDAGFSMQDVLYFKKAEEYQLVNEEELEIVRGQNSTNVQADYSEYLNNGRAFKLVLTKENQIAGNYSAEITWTLADAPTE